MKFCCRKGCGAEFDRKNNRDRHELRKLPCSNNEIDVTIDVDDAVADPPVVKIYKCPNSWCNKEDKKKFNIDRHVLTCKNKTKWMQCFICKKTFNRQTNLRRHMEVHAQPRDKKKRGRKSADQKLVETEVMTAPSTDDFRQFIANNVLPTLPSSSHDHDEEVHEENNRVYILDDEDNLLFTSVGEHSPIPEISFTNASLLQFQQHNVLIDNSGSHTMDDIIDDADSIDFSGPPMMDYVHAYLDTSDEILGFSQSCMTDNLNAGGESVDSSRPRATDNFDAGDEGIDSSCPRSCPRTTDDLHDDGEGVNFSRPSSTEDLRDDDEGVNSSRLSSDEASEDDSEGDNVNSTDDEGCLTLGSADVLKELENQTSYVECSVRYIKTLIHQSKRSIKKRISTAKHIKQVFSDKLTDETFMEYLARHLNFDSTTELRTYISWSEKDYSYVTGRREHAVSEETAQKVVDFWKQHSVVSVDRRNDRHLVRISKRKCHPTYLKVSDDERSIHMKDTIVTGKLEAHRHIYTTSFRKLHKSYNRENPMNYVSHGLFHQLKPFYITSPTVNEKESCLCIKCQNVHGLYEPLKKYDKTLPSSLTEFLTKNFTCEKDNKLSFVKLDCIRSTCSNHCQISTTQQRNFVEKTPKKYYTFDKVPTFYYNKDGKKVTYDRVTRVDKEATLDELYQKLNDVAQDYLEHRHSVVADRSFWAYMHEVLDQPYIHLDYSQNIALKPKHEVQAMHFSGKEQTLHCTVLVNPDENTFIYHLSDDTIHDCTMTSFILQSIITEHPELIKGGKLILKSDNCSTQYKSRKVFEEMKRLAANWDVEIYWFYGEAGHGRGLVDAMSSFGCKKLLRDGIVCEDVWFKDAAAMKTFLDKEYITDGGSKKEYYLVDNKETAARRRRGRKTLKRDGCMKFCLMAVNQRGQWMVRENLDINDENIVKFIFDDAENCYDANEFDYTEIVDEESTRKEREVPDDLLLPIVYEVVTPGDFVALRSESQSLEQFYIVQVVSKDVAQSYDVKDNHGHLIAKGQPYFSVNYLEKSVKSTKKNIKYTYSKTKSVYVHVGEVFATNIQVDEKLSMSAAEYQSLLTELFS